MIEVHLFCGRRVETKLLVLLFAVILGLSTNTFGLVCYNCDYEGAQPCYDNNLVNRWLECPITATYCLTYTRADGRKFKDCAAKCKNGSVTDQFGSNVTALCCSGVDKCNCNYKYAAGCPPNKTAIASSAHRPDVIFGLMPTLTMNNKQQLIVAFTLSAATVLPLHFVINHYCSQHRD